MAVMLNPYLSFRDQARPAMEFYRSIFGGELQMMTFQDFQVSKDPAEANKIMHAMLAGEHGIVFMAADMPNSMPYDPGANISMSLSGDDEARLSQYFQKLSQGGQVGQPLQKAPWGDTFGACTDRFGINWMVNISGQPNG